MKAIGQWMADNDLYFEVHRSGPETIDFQNDSGDVKLYHCESKRILVRLCSSRYGGNRYLVTNSRGQIVETQGVVHGLVAAGLETVLEMLSNTHSLIVTDNASGEEMQTIKVPQFSEVDIEEFNTAIFEYN